MQTSKHTVEIRRQEIEDIKYICAFLRYIEHMIPPRTEEIARSFDRARTSAERLRDKIVSA